MISFNQFSDKIRCAAFLQLQLQPLTSYLFFHVSWSQWDRDVTAGSDIDIATEKTKRAVDISRSSRTKR